MFLAESLECVAIYPTVALLCFGPTLYGFHVLLYDVTWLVIISPFCSSEAVDCASVIH